MTYPLRQASSRNVHQLAYVRPSVPQTGPALRPAEHDVVAEQVTHCGRFVAELSRHFIPELHVMSAQVAEARPSTVTMNYIIVIN